MKARLAMYKNGTLDRAFPLPEPGTTIGRDDDNYIRLSDPRVSRKHAAILAQDDMWMINDLESTNGVLVNGARVKNAVLKNRDVIRIGPFEMTFEAIPADAEWPAPHGAATAPAARHSTIAEQQEPAGPRTLPQPPRKPSDSR